MGRIWGILASGLLSTALASGAAAQDWAGRKGDVAPSQEALSQTLVGQTLVFFDNGRSEFAADGAYSYTYDQGGTAYGRYEIGPDATVCILFQNGFDRCDRYVINGARLIVQTAAGDRFPVREQMQTQ